MAKGVNPAELFPQKSPQCTGCQAGATLSAHNPLRTGLRRRTSCRHTATIRKLAPSPTFRSTHLRHAYCNAHHAAEALSANLSQEITMKSKTILAAAAAGLLWTMGASAAPTIGGEFPANDSEVPPALGTIHSLDTRTGGYKGWGPMASPHLPASPSESDPMNVAKEDQQYAQQLAEVRQVRDQVWVANAPLRADYENIGATRSHAGGFGRFFHRDSTK
jgi:hypothetical protein